MSMSIFVLCSFKLSCRVAIVWNVAGGESGNSNASPKRRSPQASSSSSGGGTPVDFDCPEEFGYYAHPTDCTQYYVCVFGGALLESCTGGLMYSHELQTCDWPRNVGCAPGSSASQQVQQIQPETQRQRQSSPPQRERIIQQQIPPKHDLYTEDDQLSPEELDSDRQQRVYRGQPQAIGQVQSDRDALSTHSNAIPVPGRDKLSVVSYGTQQQYTSFDRHKPTGDVIQDKSDHNFLTNITRRFRRQAQLRSHQDAYDTAPISWSSVQPRIVHHRRPQLIPHMYPSPQPAPPPHPSISSLYPNRRPSYHRRPNEFKFESNNAKYVKYQSSTHPPLGAALSTQPTHYAYHNQYKPSSSAVETNYHHNVFMKQSTFRPSFGPPGYQTVQSNAVQFTTQRPREHSTKNPTAYKSQVTKPPINYYTSTTPARKPTSYVYASNNMHQNSGLQLNKGPTNEKPEDEGGGSKDEESEEEEEDYVEDDDEEDETSTQQRPSSKEQSKESQESSERPKSTENASVSSSGERFRPSFPEPPPNFYKDTSASVSYDDKNPFANPDFDFNKFLDELREHHVQQTNGDPSTPSSYLYYEYPSSSSSKESNEYYYPKETTPKYYNKPPNHKYPEKEGNDHDDSRPSKEILQKPGYDSEESEKASQKPNSPEDSTSKYYYNTSKHTAKHNPFLAPQSTPKYQGHSSEQPYYSSSPHYYQHSVADREKPTTKSQYGSTYFTTLRPPSSGIKSAEEYVDDFIGKHVRNSTYLRPPKPPRVPKEPLRLQNIDNEGTEDEYENDESDEYYDDDEEGDVEGDDEDYEDEEEPSAVNQDASVSNEKSKEETRPTVSSSEPSSVSVEHLPSNTKYSQQTVKLIEHTTPNHLTKLVSVQGGKCFSVRGKVKCLEPPSGPTASTALQNQPAVLYSNANQYITPSYSSTTYRPPSHHNHRPRMRRPTSPIPSPSTESTLTPPPLKFTTYNSSRVSPMLLSPSYSPSTEPVAVRVKVPKQRQNRNKYELEDTDMRDKGHTQRALTRLRASVTPAQQQYVEQQTQQQTPPPRAYNQSRYVPSQYDPPLYTFYDDDVDLYKEIGDYAQYNSQGKSQYRTQYKEKAPQIEIVQQEPARPTYSKNKYNSQSDLYQSVTPQEYESYSIQTNDDLPYRQPQQTKSSTRSEVKESDDSRVSTASPRVEKATTSRQTVQQTDSTISSPVTTSQGIKAERLVSDGPFVFQIGRVANTPSPFKLPETESESPVNLLTRGHFVVREPEVVTQQVVDITPKPNNRNRVDGPQRTIAIRVPQAAIDSNKYSSDEAKQRLGPIRASESAEWNGFKVGGEIGSNHQEEVSRRPSLRVPDSIKVREDYLRSRQGSKDEPRLRGPVRKQQGGRGSSRYQESTYELEDLERDTQSEREENARPPVFRSSNEEDQKFAAEAEKNARIQAQFRASDDTEYKRKQDELRRKALEEARVRQIEDAEREAMEQVRQRQFEQARLRQVEEAERVAKELEERKEREEAQRKANEDARRRLIEEARKKQLEEARKKQIEEAQLKAREEYERKAKEEAARKAAQEEEERRILEEEERTRKLIEARRAKEEADRRAAVEEAQRRAVVEEARRRAAAEEAQRRAAVEEAQKRAAAEEARKRAAAEEAQKRAAAEEAQKRAAAEEAQRRTAVQDAKKKAAEEARRKQLDNLRQLEEGLSRRRGPQSRTSQDDISFRPSYDNTERSRQRPNSFRIVVDTTEPPATPQRTSLFGDARPPKKYVSRNSTLINELYLNEQSTSFPDTMTPNSLSQTSPGRIYTENTRKTLETPLPISKSGAEYSEKPVRVRPTSYDTQSTPGLTRGGSRHRGGQSYTVSSNDAEPAPAPNRGTPAAPRVRPTLKPSTTVVGKATEYSDIYRYPPRRPDNVYPTPQVDKTAAKCRKDVCLLPDCSCGGKDIPGELTLEETPQIVLLTFDDSVNDLNKGLYEDLFERGRVNPNGCPISATFYVSHEWTDYSQVQNLYSTGHEIASHSVSHSFGEQFSQKKWTKEIAGQREILAAYGGVKQEDIRGMRAPFLAIGGNKMFKMLYDANFTYDSSMPVYENKPPSWPYTMDYKIFHDCMIPPCPTKSYPGVWEVPMVMWQDLNGGRCSMGDACSNPPEAEGVYKMLIKNFERHFTTNRAPFGLFYHAAWFTQPHHKEGFIAFLDTINKMPEVWVVTNWQAIQWVRDPTPINRVNNFAPFGCNYPDRPKKCNNPKVCNLWHKSGVRYMRTCQPCPDVYPWTGKSGVRNSRVETEIINE